MRFSRLLSVVTLIGVLFSSVPAHAATEMDLLLKKLVEKNILTEQEAAEVKAEVKEEAARSAKAPPPSPGGNWLANTKWAGDLRLRHETQFREPAKDRNRERFRARFGFTTKPWEPLELGVRLATGASGDPVSTNQSFTGTFDKKAVFIDKAYAKYTAAPWAALIGGKMDNPFAVNSELVWDGDVTPEGVAAQFKAPEALRLPFQETFPSVIFLNIGAFPVSEINGDYGDPAVFGFQIGKEVKFPRGFSWYSSIAYYDFTAVKGKRTSDINQVTAPSGNTTLGPAAAPVYRDDFNLVDVQGNLGLPPIFGQPVVLIGNLVHNTEAADDDTAWHAGLKVGKVTEKLGSWEAGYFYKQVPSDALFGAITDSDFGGGGTNHEGHKLGVRMGLNKYAEAGISYSRTDEVDGAQNRVNTLQVDAILKY
jgi:hypothetical protein